MTQLLTQILTQENTDPSRYEVLEEISENPPEPIAATQPEYPDLLPNPSLIQQLRAFLCELNSQHRAVGEEIKEIDRKRNILSTRSYELSQDIAALNSVSKRFPDMPSDELDPN